MITRAHATSAGRRRPAFTLVEMMVVIAIVGILVSLGAAAYFKWLDNQKQTTTETTMRQVYQNLAQQMKAVTDAAYKDPNIPTSVITMAGGDMRRARVIWMKLKLKQEFPMSYYEAYYPYAAPDGTVVIPATDLPPKAWVKKLPAPAAPPTAAPTPGVAEASTCLLLALSQARGGARFNPDDLPNTAVNDTNGDGLKEIVDAWGVPLAFYRWPTGNSELRGTNPAPAGSKQTRFADPLDPDGLLLVPAWYWQGGVVGTPNPARLQFESLCHPISPDNGNTAYYIIPALVSAGVDGAFGLDGTMNADGSGADADNLYSWRLRLGNKGTLQ